MSFNSKLRQNYRALGVTALSGAAPQTGAGNAVQMQDVVVGTLCANIYAQATTNTLTISAKWKVSDNGITWRDAKVPNNAANVVIVTGTGSAVADNIVLAAPDCVYGKRYAKCDLVTAGATAAAGDEYNISYGYQGV